MVRNCSMRLLVSGSADAPGFRQCPGRLLDGINRQFNRSLGDIPSFEVVESVKPGSAQTIRSDGNWRRLLGR